MNLRKILSGKALPVAFVNQSGYPPIRVLSNSHYFIHLGESFQASYAVPDASPIADNASLDILCITGSIQPHLTWNISAGGDAEVFFYEESITSDNGTEVASHNLTRSAINLAHLSTFHTPTISSVGELLHNQHLHGGTGGNAGGGSESGVGRDDSEWVLLADTSYLWRVFNRAGNSKTISILLQWYEVNL